MLATRKARLEKTAKANPPRTRISPERAIKFHGAAAKVMYSQHGGAYRDGGRCRCGVAGRKAYVSVQKKQHEGYRIFGKYDHDDKSAIARVRRAEEMRDRKQQGGDERVRERRDPQCHA